jgi:hypothetical protein
MGLEGGNAVALERVTVTEYRIDVFSRTNAPIRVVFDLAPDMPTVRFYDRRYVDDTRHDGTDGQFTGGSYYAKDIYSQTRGGLALAGDIPAWTLTEPVMKAIREWMRSVIHSAENMASAPEAKTHQMITPSGVWELFDVKADCPLRLSDDGRDISAGYPPRYNGGAGTVIVNGTEIGPQHAGLAWTCTYGHGRLWETPFYAPI